MVPVLAAMSPVLGMNPYVLILACTLGAIRPHDAGGNALGRDRARNGARRPGDAGRAGRLARTLRSQRWSMRMGAAQVG